MIPKIIHYCWFGGNPLPDDALKCIRSWKKYFPDYEIKEWNETNFDLSCCNYVQEAYQEKKWAFVSDYARFWILYNYGGLYFDTDVEVIKSFSDIIQRGPFLGEELSGDQLVVNPGLGMGANRNMSLYKAVLEYYDDLHFDPKNIVTVVKHTTEILQKSGYVGNGKIENICDVNVYPPCYFSPKNYFSGDIHITENTHSIHHYENSWNSKKSKEFYEVEKKLIRIFGNDISKCFLIKLCRNLYTEGVLSTLKKGIKTKAKKRK